MQTIKIMLLGALLVLGPAAAAFSADEALPEREKPAAEDILGAERPALRPVPEVRPGTGELPELPKPLKRTKRSQLTAAETVRLDETERKRVEGALTETEANLRKDTLARESNIQF